MARSRRAQKRRTDMPLMASANESRQPAPAASVCAKWFPNSGLGERGGLMAKARQPFVVPAELVGPHRYYARGTPHSLR